MHEMRRDRRVICLALDPRTLKGPDKISLVSQLEEAHGGPVEFEVVGQLTAAEMLKLSKRPDVVGFLRGPESTRQVVEQNTKPIHAWEPNGCLRKLLAVY